MITIFISVILALYNGEKYITEQLDSLRLQTLQPNEVLLFDDGSTDGTVPLVQAYIQKYALPWQLTVNPQNLGYSRNFLQGLRAAKGDLLFLCDQDDVWLPERIEEMCALMQQNPQIAAVSSRYSVIDGQGQPISNHKVTYVIKDFNGKLEQVPIGELIGCSFIRGFSLCLRKQVVPLVQDLELKSLLGHDWYLCILSALQGQLCFYNKCLGFYRVHGGNVSVFAENHRATLQGTALQKRINGLKESILAHRSLLGLQDLPNLPTVKPLIQHFCAFEQKRLAFLSLGGLHRWLGLLGGLKEYKRYYKSLKGAFRVWFGDLLYKYKKQ